MRARGALTLVVAPVAVSLGAAGCGSTVHKSGPIEVSLTRVGAPAGAFKAPPDGFELLSCSVEVVNTSDGTITVDYPHAQLVLYEGDREVGGDWEGASYGAGTAAGRALEDTATQLPSRASVSVHRVFLVEPGQRDFRLVYQVRDYPEFTWRVH
jgi:hypothetical protein